MALCLKIWLADFLPIYVTNLCKYIVQAFFYANIYHEDSVHDWLRKHIMKLLLTNSKTSLSETYFTSLNEYVSDMCALLEFNVSSLNQVNDYYF